MNSCFYKYKSNTFSSTSTPITSQKFCVINIYPATSWWGNGLVLRLSCLCQLPYPLPALHRYTAKQLHQTGNKFLLVQILPCLLIVTPFLAALRDCVEPDAGGEAKASIQYTANQQLCILTPNQNLQKHTSTTPTTPTTTQHNKPNNPSTNENLSMSSRLSITTAQVCTDVHTVSPAQL